MIKNIVSLILSLTLIISMTSYKVLALKNREFYEFAYYDSENDFLNKIGIDQLRDKFFEKFKIFDEDREKNKFLMEENKDLNREIKCKLKESKGNISQETWKEIRTYKNEINDMKISTKEKVKEIIEKQKEFLQNSNYSDESIENFINVLISVQKLKRESIEFEQPSHRVSVP